MTPRIRISAKSPKKKRGSAIASGPQPICQACQLQFSRYTCPSCNFHYCTLTCFRSTLHIACSEAFDRQSLVDDIKSTRGTSTEDKAAMLAMLEKFEEQNGLVESGDDDGNGGQAELTTTGDEEDKLLLKLAERLEQADLDSMAPDELFALLSPAQRAEFEGMLTDPTQLDVLISAHEQFQPPWWIEPSNEERLHDTLNHGISKSDAKQAGCTPSPRPALLQISTLPTLKSTAEGKPAVNASLVHNIVAILCSYALACRSFSLPTLANLAPSSTDRTEVYAMFERLVPFLTTPSTFAFETVADAARIVFENPSSAVRYVRRPLVQLKEKTSDLGLLVNQAPQVDSQIIQQISSDVVYLMTPNKVVTMQDPHLTGQEVSANALAALADLERFFSQTASSTRDKKIPARHAVHKLRFYCVVLGHLASTSSTTLSAICTQLDLIGGELASKSFLRETTKPTTENFREIPSARSRNLVEVLETESYD